VTAAQAETQPWLAALPPALFLCLWLFVTALFGLFSGWFRLQRQFPRSDETPLLRLRMQSGMMGWIHLNGVLTLDACESGLRVGMWRLFGPFERPFEVPWDRIEAEPVSPFLLGPMVRLRFGRPEAGRLAINLRAWERLKAASQGMAAPLTRATARRIERGLFLQWLAATLLIGTIFSVIVRSQDMAADPIPVALCFGFPAVFFGFTQLVRYLAQTR
jgi:hypothetical protein